MNNSVNRVCTRKNKTITHSIVVEYDTPGPGSVELPSQEEGFVHAVLHHFQATQQQTCASVTYAWLREVHNRRVNVW